MRFRRELLGSALGNCEVNHWLARRACIYLTEPKVEGCRFENVIPVDSNWGLIFSQPLLRFLPKIDGL